MTSGQSSDSLTPLIAEHHELQFSDYDRMRVTEWMATGAHAIEDVDGAARYDEQVVISDIGAVKTRVGKRVK